MREINKHFFKGNKVVSIVLKCFSGEKKYCSEIRNHGLCVGHNFSHICDFELLQNHFLNRFVSTQMI